MNKVRGTLGGKAEMVEYILGLAGREGMVGREGGKSHQNYNCRGPIWPYQGLFFSKFFWITQRAQPVHKLRY